LKNNILVNQLKSQKSKRKTVLENFNFTICCKDLFYISFDFDHKNGLFIVNIEYYIEIVINGLAFKQHDHNIKKNNP
jgi:hypothetical protein